MRRHLVWRVLDVLWCVTILSLLHVCSARRDADSSVLLSIGADEVQQLEEDFSTKSSARTLTRSSRPAIQAVVLDPSSGATTKYVTEDEELYDPVFGRKKQRSHRRLQGFRRRKRVTKFGAAAETATQRTGSGKGKGRGKGKGTGKGKGKLCDDGEDDGISNNGSDGTQEVGSGDGDDTESDDREAGSKGTDNGKGGRSSNRCGKGRRRFNRPRGKGKGKGGSKNSSGDDDDDGDDGDIPGSPSASTAPSATPGPTNNPTPPATNNPTECGDNVIIRWLLVDSNLTLPDAEIRTLTLPDDTLILENISAQSLNIVVEVVSPDDCTESVLFESNDISSRNQLENTIPYALGSDNRGNFGTVRELSQPGTYTIDATPFTGPNAGGDMGMTQTLTLTVVNTASLQSS